MTSVSTTASLLSTATSASTTAVSSSSSTSSSSSSTDTSSIDWDGLVEEAVNAKLSKADSIDLKITKNEAKSAAYESLQSLLSSLETAANALRAPSGSTAASTDAFKARTAYLTANGDVDASSSVSATIDAGSQIGSYSLTISQLAVSHKVASATQTSQTDELGYTGVMSVGTDGGTSADITISSDMSLAEIAEAINGQSSTTGVQASVLKVSSSSYELVLSGTSTGTTIAASTVSGDDVLGSLGVTSSDGSFADVLQEAKNAVFSIDGVEITRSTNDVDDVLDGVSLHLYQTTPDDTSITLEVGTDLSSVKTAVSNLVDAYNAYRDFAYEQQQIPSDSNSDTTVLFGDGTLRNIGSDISSALNSTVNSRALSLLGLSFDQNNKLVLDEDTLDNALLSNLTDIQSLLSFQMTSSSSNLMLLSRGSEVPSAFTLDVTTDSSGNLTSASINGDSSMFSVSGTRIIGKTGTKYEGYTFVYTGGSGSVDLSFSTGIAELLYNISDTASNTTDGTLQTLMDQITDTDNTLQDKSDDIRSDAATYKTNLTNRYAQYQAAIDKADSLRSYLEQLINTWNSSSSS